MTTINLRTINAIFYFLGVVTFLFTPFAVQASIFSRLMGEALDGAMHTAPRIGIRELQKELNKPTKEAGNVEDDLLLKIKKIDEKTGKMANSITNTIFLCNTPEQKTIPKSECVRIKGEFKKRVNGEALSQVKLIFMINYKCTDYSTDVMEALHEKISSGKSSVELKNPLTELKKCSKYLNLIKGYDLSSANSYSALAEKFLPLINDKNITNKDDQRIMSALLASTIFSTKAMQEQVRKAASEWF